VRFSTRQSAGGTGATGSGAPAVAPAAPAAAASRPPMVATNSAALPAHVQTNRWGVVADDPHGPHSAARRDAGVVGKGVRVGKAGMGVVDNAPVVTTTPLTATTASSVSGVVPGAADTRTRGWDNGPARVGMSMAGVQAVTAALRASTIAASATKGDKPAGRGRSRGTGVAPGTAVREDDDDSGTRAHSTVPSSPAAIMSTKSPAPAP